MTAASLISEVRTSQSHKIKLEVTGDRLNMQEIFGRRVSRSGVLHLVEDKNLSHQDWLTLCGRKIPTETTLPVENFDGGDICCNVCILMQNRKKPTLKTAETRF